MSDELRALFDRIEQQAKRIAELEAEVQRLQSSADSVPLIMRQEKLHMYRSMAGSSVLCGPNSGCALAKRLLGQAINVSSAMGDKSDE